MKFVQLEEITSPMNFILLKTNVHKIRKTDNLCSGRGPMAQLVNTTTSEDNKFPRVIHQQTNRYN